MIFPLNFQLSDFKTISETLAVSNPLNNSTFIPKFEITNINQQRQRNSKQLAA